MNEKSATGRQRAGVTMHSLLGEFPTAQERERNDARDKAEQAERSAATAELEAIALAADNPDTAPGKLNALLIGRSLRLLLQVHRLPIGADVSGFTHELAGLRAAHRMVLDGHQLRRRDDLDLNSPKYGFAYSFVLAALEESMDRVGIHKETAKRVFLELHDIVSVGEEQLKRELKNVTAIPPGFRYPGSGVPTACRKEAASADKSGDRKE